MGDRGGMQRSRLELVVVAIVAGACGALLPVVLAGLGEPVAHAAGLGTVKAKAFVLTDGVTTRARLDLAVGGGAQLDVYDAAGGVVVRLDATDASPYPSLSLYKDGVKRTMLTDSGVYLYGSDAKMRAEIQGSTTYGMVNLYNEGVMCANLANSAMSLSPADGRRLALSADGVIVSNATGGLFSAGKDPFSADLRGIVTITDQTTSPDTVKYIRAIP